MDRAPDEPLSHSAVRLATIVIGLFVLLLLAWVATTTIAVLTGNVSNGDPDPLTIPARATTTTAPALPEPAVVAPEPERPTATLSEKALPPADAESSIPPLIDFVDFEAPLLTDRIGDEETTRVRRITVTLGPGEGDVLLAIDNGLQPVDTSGRGVAVRTDTVLEMLTNRGFTVIDRPANCESGCDVTFWTTAGGGFQQSHPNAVLMVYVSGGVSGSSIQLDALPSLTRALDTCSMLLGALDAAPAVIPKRQVPVATSKLGQIDGPRHRSVTAMLGGGSGDITVVVWNGDEPIARDSSGIAVRTRETARLFNDRMPVSFERPDTCSAGTSYEFWVTISPQFASLYPAAELRIYADPDVVVDIDEIDRLPAHSSR